MLLTSKALSSCWLPLATCSFSPGEVAVVPELICRFYCWLWFALVCWPLPASRPPSLSPGTPSKFCRFYWLKSCLESASCWANFSGFWVKLASSKFWSVGRAGVLPVRSPRLSRPLNYGLLFRFSRPGMSANKLLCKLPTPRFNDPGIAPKFVRSRFDRPVGKLFALN